MKAIKLNLLPPKSKQRNKTYEIQKEVILWKKMHFKNGITILQLLCILKKIEKELRRYEMIGQIWDKMRN